MITHSVKNYVNTNNNKLYLSFNFLKFLFNISSQSLINHINIKKLYIIMISYILYDDEEPCYSINIQFYIFP